MTKCRICSRTDFTDWYSYRTHYLRDHKVNIDDQPFNIVIARRPKKEVTASFETRMAQHFIDSSSDVAVLDPNIVVLPAQQKVDPWDHLMKCLDVIDENIATLERIFGAQGDAQ